MDIRYDYTSDIMSMITGSDARNDLNYDLPDFDESQIVKLSVYNRGSYIESYELTKDVDYILNNNSIIFDEVWTNSLETVTYLSSTLEIKKPIRTSFSNNTKRILLSFLNLLDTYEFDEKVRLRITEINVARFQDRAREAARVGDWALTEFFIREARREAKGNEWLNSVIDRLEVYAKDRQRQNFSKEALYSSDKMNKRLVSDDEINMNYSIDLESSKNAYLRRKVERGKRFS